MQKETEQIQSEKDFKDALMLSHMVLSHVAFLVNLSEIKDEKYEISENIYIVIKNVISINRFIFKGRDSVELNKAQEVMLLICDAFELAKRNDKKCVIHPDMANLILKVHKLLDVSLMFKV